MSEENETNEEGNADDELKGTKVFASLEDSDAAAMIETADAARAAGFTRQVVDDDNGHLLCAPPDSMELVDIFPDGSWEYQNVDENGKGYDMSGINAVMLAYYLASDENKALFAKQAKAE